LHGLQQHRVITRAGGDEFRLQHLADLIRLVLEAGECRLAGLPPGQPLPHQPFIPA
jgi:hypothetical protein